MFCDLHTHSYRSDGTDSPSRLIELAKSENRIVALTDHNTTAGLSEFMEKAGELGVTAVPGVELSCEFEGTELHLIGLFIPREHYATVEEWASQMRARKQISNRETVARLCAAGYVVDYEDIARRHEGYVNRAHIAEALCRAGYVQSINDAFDDLLAEKHGYYIPPKRPTIFDALAFLVQIQALPVLAHPLKDLDRETLCRLLDRIVPAGLVSMEIHHSSYNEEQTAVAAEIAKAYGLLGSGGSDYHGKRKENCPFGIPEVSRVLYDNLCQYWQKSM